MTPKTEWLVIDGEQDNPTHLLTNFVLPLVLLGSLAAFIGYGLIGIDSVFFQLKGIKWGFWFGLQNLIASIAGFFIATYVIDMLAPSFASEKNIGKSAQLVSYSSTPLWLSRFFLIHPSLSILGILGLYGIYLFYLGLPVLKKTPEDKRITYMIVSALVVMVVSWFAQWIIGQMLIPLLGNPYGTSVKDLKEIFK